MPGPPLSPPVLMPLPQPPTPPLPPAPAGRAAMVQKQFPEAIGADDFVQRVEMALHAFGFSGENSIGEAAGVGAHVDGGRA